MLHVIFGVVSIFIHVINCTIFIRYITIINMVITINNPINVYNKNPISITVECPYFTVDLISHIKGSKNPISITVECPYF